MRHELIGICFIGLAWMTKWWDGNFFFFFFIFGSIISEPQLMTLLPKVEEISHFSSIQKKDVEKITIFAPKWSYLIPYFDKTCDISLDIEILFFFFKGRQFCWQNFWKIFTLFPNSDFGL